MDPFDLAFSDAVKGLAAEPPVPGSDQEQKTDPPAKTAEELEAERIAAEEVAKTDPPAKTAEEIAAEEAAAAEAARQAEEAAKKTDPPAKTPEQIELEALKAEVAALKAKPAPAAPASQAKTAEELAAEEAEKTKRAADAAEMEAFKKDWPEPAAMLEKLEARFTNLLSGLQQKIDQLQQSFAPIATATVQTAQEKFEAALAAAHEDWAELTMEKGPVDQWIATLPTYQQAGANQVLEKGSAQQVVELLNAYRQAHPKAAPAETPEQIAARQAQELEKQRKVASLGVVPDARTAPPKTTPDKNNFDDAFSEAVTLVASGGAR